MKDYQDKVVGIVSRKGRQVNGQPPHERLVELHTELAFAAHVKDRKGGQVDQPPLRFGVEENISYCSSDES